MSAIGLDREAQRQQALLQAVSSTEPVAVADLQALPGPHGQARADAGLRAYRRNAMATAWRALMAVYPTLQQVLGGEAMKALARDLWRAQPPLRGDLAWFGAGLPEHLAAMSDYAHLPWLADLARLDWAVHLAGFAADAPAEIEGLALLGQQDPQHLALVWAPGCQWLGSAWPVEALWWAHQTAEESEQASRLAAANAALLAGRRDSLWVQRQGLEVVVLREGKPAAATFNALLWQGASLGEALDATVGAEPAEFSFEAWLVQTLQTGRLAAVHLIPSV